MFAVPMLAVPFRNETVRERYFEKYESYAQKPVAKWKAATENITDV
jgi:hypothetical protein